MSTLNLAVRNGKTMRGISNYVYHQYLDLAILVTENGDLMRRKDLGDMTYEEAYTKARENMLKEAESIHDLIKDADVTADAYFIIDNENAAAAALESDLLSWLADQNGADFIVRFLQNGAIGLIPYDDEESWKVAVQDKLPKLLAIPADALMTGYYIYERAAEGLRFFVNRGSDQKIAITKVLTYGKTMVPKQVCKPYAWIGRDAYMKADGRIWRLPRDAWKWVRDDDDQVPEVNRDEPANDKSPEEEAPAPAEPAAASGSVEAISTGEKLWYGVAIVSEGETTGYVQMTKEEAELVSRVTKPCNWQKANVESWAGTFFIEMSHPLTQEEFEKL